MKDNPCLTIIKRTKSGVCRLIATGWRAGEGDSILNCGSEQYEFHNYIDHYYLEIQCYQIQIPTSVLHYSVCDSHKCDMADR
jgi:hypothetical protein